MSKATKAKLLPSGSRESPDIVPSTTRLPATQPRQRTTQLPLADRPRTDRREDACPETVGFGPDVLLREGVVRRAPVARGPQVPRRQGVRVGRGDG